METRRDLGWQPQGRTAGKRRRKRKKGRSNVILALLIIILLFVLVYILLPGFCIKSELRAEAGDPVPAADAYMSMLSGSIVSGPEGDTLQAGDYDVEISVLGRTGTCKLHVEDTIAPVFGTRDQEIMLGNSVSAVDFVTEVQDATECRIEFREKPNLYVAGVQTVKLIVTDAGNNFTLGQAKLTIISDTTPPVITGVSDQTITVGDSISYKKGVEVTDDIDTEVSLEIDNSQVDTGKIGDYRVVYSATDKAGNHTDITATIHVIPKEKKQEDVAITAEFVEAEADRILYKIINSEMSQMEIIRAIYDWCHEKVAYSDGASKNDWVQGAYDGLVNRRGDCYTYAMTAKVLLTRAGITNKDIEKIPTPTTMHYWNLVDVGEGWHHFDTCRRADGSTFFYKTDAELMEYSNSHKGTHNYDRTIYTDIQ